MSKSATAAGVLLAAGAGTRYGMPKSACRRRPVAACLRDRAGRRRMRRRCRGVGRRGGRRACARAVGGRAGLGAGLSASVRAGVTAVDASYVVLHAVDTPDVGADAVRRVLDVARSSASGLARARYGDRPGHPVVIARRYWPDLLEGLRGDEGARPFLGGRTDVVAVDCADLASGRDIDVS